VAPHIVFDLSALLAMAERRTPRGIPRVELAYAKHFIATAPDQLCFTGFWGRLGVVPGAAALALVEALDACWSGVGASKAAGDRAVEIARRLQRDILLRGEAGLYRRLPRGSDNLVFVIVSHPLLGRMRTLQRFKDRTGARFLCLIHDLIGIEFPDYVPRRQMLRHHRRMESVARFADAVIVNSASTGAAFQRRYQPMGFKAPLVVAPLGIDLGVDAAPAPGDGTPYFVCIATIEPRKNHALLFHLWRRLAAQLGAQTPRLVLVGHRGWKSKAILKPIARSSPLAGLIEEHNSLPDAAVARLLAGARALLYPSLAEGYGLPVAEALALGVPVICSDLPELREVGRTVPEYLDPHDEHAWEQAVLDYAAPSSTRRQAQTQRLSSWRIPSWQQHFAIVHPVIEDVLRTRSIT
jgi:glycosyltransferase involved in cell wall biosynthesis